MKTSAIAFSVASVLVIVAFVASLLRIHIASALRDATSSASVATTTAPVGGAPATQTAAVSSGSSQSPAPQTLTLVHIVGTKYVDYFTDGTKIYSFPGDPAIDGRLNQPNAPIPTHTGLTWVRRVGWVRMIPQAAT